MPPSLPRKVNAVQNLAILAGVAFDRLLGDPPTHHPVAYFGKWVTGVEKRMYRDSRAAGALLVTATTVPFVAAFYAAHRRAPRVATAATLWLALGGRTLERTGTELADDLARGDLDAARAWIPWLCSRDPNALDAAGMARAGVESIAENTSDATVAPIVWAALAGAPGVVLHRCVNTLDAMVGYKNDKYLRFGWAAARLDDALAYLPARLTALIHTAIAASRGRGWQAVEAWQKDAPAHPSPNAGPVEATAAAALGVQLGGLTEYPHGVELRPTLGTGSPPDASTLRDAVQLARLTQAIAVVVTLAASSVVRRRVASLRGRK